MCLIVKESITKMINKKIKRGQKFMWAFKVFNKEPTFLVSQYRYSCIMKPGLVKSNKNISYNPEWFNESDRVYHGCHVFLNKPLIPRNRRHLVVVKVKCFLNDYVVNVNNFVVAGTVYGSSCRSAVFYSYYIPLSEWDQVFKENVK